MSFAELFAPTTGLSIGMDTFLTILGVFVAVWFLVLAFVAGWVHGCRRTSAVYEPIVKNLERKISRYEVG